MLRIGIYALAFCMFFLAWGVSQELPNDAQKNSTQKKVTKKKKKSDKSGTAMSPDQHQESSDGPKGK
jgi:hypothetical protein